MYYENKLKNKEMKYKLFNYSHFKDGINADMDESLIPFNQGVNSYNFSYKNGALSTGLGLKPVEITYYPDDLSLTRGLENPGDTQILGIWSQDTYYSDMDLNARMLFAYGKDKKLYYHYLHFNNTTFLALENCPTFDEMPEIILCFINGHRTYLISTPSGGLKSYRVGEWELKDVKGAPAISSYCLHDGRLFATDYVKQNRVWFSDNDDPTNWQLGNDQAGFVEFNDQRGHCVKVVSFEGDVYVFREYGITKISSFKNQANIVTENVYVSSSAILKNTICLCGDKILFMTKNGLFSFNGNSVSNVDLNVDSWLRKVNNFSMAKYYNDAYYLTCNIDFDDDKKIGCESGNCTNNSLVKIDLEEKSVSVLRGVDITFLNVLRDVGVNILVAVMKDNDEFKLGMVCENGKIFDEKTFKYWKSTQYDFDMPNKKKFVKNFYINTDVKTTINFLHDSKITSFEIEPSEEIATISPRISGYKIGVEIICEEGSCNISSPKILVGVL